MINIFVNYSHDLNRTVFLKYKSGISNLSVNEIHTFLHKIVRKLSMHNSFKTSGITSCPRYGRTTNRLSFSVFVVHNFGHPPGCIRPAGFAKLLTVAVLNQPQNTRNLVAPMTIDKIFYTRGGYTRCSWREGAKTKSTLNIFYACLTHRPSYKL